MFRRPRIWLLTLRITQLNLSLIKVERRAYSRGHISLKRFADPTTQLKQHLGFTYSSTQNNIPVSAPLYTRFCRMTLKTEPVYKTVSIRTALGEISLKLKESVHAWLSASMNDPIVKTIAENSHLTKTQLETLLIDVLSETIANKPLKYDEKATLRLTKAKLSRGAFNRTLKQAKENVTKSIFTVLLLGYLGIFDTTTLDPYLEIANKLHSYRDACEGTPDTKENIGERLKTLQTIKEELETSLRNLSTAS
jgi:hypothetical protein